MLRERVARLLTWRRARAYALVFVAVYVVAYVDVIAMGDPPLNSGGVPIAGDYIAFHTAARLVLSGQPASMYDHASVVALQDTLLGGRIPHFYDAYRNPPFFALVYVPLGGLDLLSGFVVWSVVSLVCLAVALRVLLAEAPWLRPRWRGLLVLVFAFPPLYFGVIDGENEMVSLLLYALIYRAFARNDSRSLGVWSALGLFKPQLFFLFPVILLVTRRWRALAWYVVTACVLSAVSLALVGVDGLQAWFRILLEPEAGNALANGWRMASAKSFLDALLPGLGGVSLVGYLGVSLALLSIVWRAWRACTDGDLALPVTFALTSLVATLIDPHLVDYDLTVLIAAAIVAGPLVPRYALIVVPLFVVSLLRAQIPIGDVGVQLTAPLLAVLALWLFRESRAGRDTAHAPTVLVAQT